MKRFLIFCSGADSAILAECPTEETKYAGIGGTIVFTAVFAGLSGGYALYTVFRSLWLTLPFSLLWALMIFNLDRVIISGMRKQIDFRHDLLYASPRVLLAMLLAVVISKPLELKLFEKEIQAQITRSHNEQYQRTVRTIDAAFGELSALETQNHALQDEVRAKQQKVDELYGEMIQEGDGTAGTGLRGQGPAFVEKKGRFEAANGQLNRLNDLNAHQMGLNEQQILRLRADRQHRLNQETADLAAADRFLGQLEGLSVLTDSNRGARLASWFITLLFIALETAPILVKLLSTLSPYRPYDQKMEDREWQIVESSEQFRKTVKVDLESASEQQIAQLNDAVMTEIAISTERNRQRRDAELQANEVLMSQIATAQTEIAERIVERWRTQELEKAEKADYAPADYVNVS